MDKTLKDEYENSKKLSEAIGLVIEVLEELRGLNGINVFYADRQITHGLECLTCAKKWIEKEEEEKSK